jgi:hypothetical protein
MEPAASAYVSIRQHTSAYVKILELQLDAMRWNPLLLLQLRQYSPFCTSNASKLSTSRLSAKSQRICSRLAISSTCRSCKTAYVSILQHTLQTSHQLRMSLLQTSFCKTSFSCWNILPLKAHSCKASFSFSHKKSSALVGMPAKSHPLPFSLPCHETCRQIPPILAIPLGGGDES